MTVETHVEYLMGMIQNPDGFLTCNVALDGGPIYIYTLQKSWTKTQDIGLGL